VKEKQEEHRTRQTLATTGNHKGVFFKKVAGKV
jgi:hypothetical protein